MIAVGKLSLTQTNSMQASSEYELARRRATTQALRSAITRRPNTLASMDELTNGQPVEGEHYAGLQQVPVRAIVGSVDRHRDFDADFNPRSDHTQHRWTSIAHAQLHGTVLPPVQLIKIDGAYMVEDGNHRVSVARHFGVEYIDAVVTEYVTVPAPAVQPAGEAGRVIGWDRWAHLARTGLQALKVKVTSRQALEAVETY